MPFKVPYYCYKRRLRRPVVAMDETNSTVLISLDKPAALLTASVLNELDFDGINPPPLSLSPLPLPFTLSPAAAGGL